MLNREKYGNEIIELAVNKGMFCIKNGEPVLCEETECKDCDFHESDSCKGSTYNFREWLNSEYVEPPVDWTKVPVDTPILVRDHENREWTRRHFAKSKTERCLHGVVGQHLGARMMKRLFRGNMPNWQKVRIIMSISRIKNRISEAATEACGYSPLTKVISEEEINRILKQESGWIPVSERLPEESLNSVIGWDTYRNRCCFVQYLGGRFVLGDDIDSVNVTAWMPQPEPYRESEG